MRPARRVSDALCRGCDGALIRDLELEGAGIRSVALRGRLSALEVARPDEHGEAVGREALRDLTTDCFVGTGDQATGLSCIITSFLLQAHISF